MLREKIRMGLFALAVVLTFPAAAQWELDDTMSSVNFVSVKNAMIAENLSFPALVGFIGEEGNVQVTINLDSVETLIPIRNERMRTMLFDTARFPTATVSAQVAPEILAEVALGGTVSTEVPVDLSLHGVLQELKVPVLVFSDGDRLQVVSSRPVLLFAPDFDLEEGIEALREVAELANISTAVPVTVNLQFKRVE